MRSAAFLAIIILIVLGVGAYALDKRGLLTRETLDLFLKPQPKTQVFGSPPIEPVALAASIQKREEELKEKTAKMEEFAARLELQRKELETEKAMLEKKLKQLQVPKSQLTASQTNPELEPGGEAVKLVKIYEGMPPEQAASILEGLPDSTVAQILLQMRRRNATQIMAEMSSNKGVAVSQLLIPERVSTSK